MFSQKKEVEAMSRNTFLTRCYTDGDSGYERRFSRANFSEQNRAGLRDCRMQAASVFDFSSN